MKQHTIVGATFIVALTAVLGAAVPASATGASYHGCPSGYVCVYPNAGWNGDRPSLAFYTYGGHNLSNQFGMHRVVNNQTDYAWVSLCRGYNGTGGLATTGSANGWNSYGSLYFDENLTPVNSIKLEKSSPSMTGNCP